MASEDAQPLVPLQAALDRQLRCPHTWAEASASPPVAQPCLSDALISRHLLSSPSKPQNHYVFARKGTGTLQATEADLFSFFFFSVHKDLGKQS